MVGLGCEVQRFRVESFRGWGHWSFGVGVDG